ncbi:MAG: RNA ligase family protein [Candidatus Acidiferrum sp.]
MCSLAYSPCASVAKPFSDPDYIFELKHDGFRALAYVEEGKCRLVSRNGNLLKSFGSLKKSLGKLRVQNAILDGEIICIDRNGISQFNQLFSRRGAPVFYAFDLLWLNHEDLRDLPLLDRKQHLPELMERNKPERIIYAQHVEGHGKLLFEEICNNDLEGIVAKWKHGVYKSNSIGWLKIRNPKYSQAEGRRDFSKRAAKR